MRRLVYTGRVSQRQLGPADGLSTTVTFVRGEPLAVSDVDAERILALVPHQFTEEAAPFPHTPPPPPPRPARSRPAKGTPEPKEG